MNRKHEKKSKTELTDEIRRLQRRVRTLEREAHRRAALAPEADARANIAENLPFYLAWKNRDLVYLGCNHNMAEVAGLEDPSEVIGKTDFDLACTEAEAKLFRAGDRRVIESGRPLINREATYRCADGTVMDIITSKSPLRGEDGQIVGVISLFADNSKSKRAVRLMQEAQDRNRLILDMVPAVIAYFDREQRFRFHNARYKTFRDVPKDELVGRTVREGVGEATYARGRPYIERALAGEPQRFEIAIDMKHVKASELLVNLVPDIDSKAMFAEFIFWPRTSPSSRRPSGRCGRAKRACRRLSSMHRSRSI